jgi:hypothetical protein
MQRPVIRVLRGYLAVTVLFALFLAFLMLVVVVERFVIG